jgi:hypothetical protein
MELAVNMPEQEPQVGQAERSYFSASSSETSGLAAWIMASIKSSDFSSPPITAWPASSARPRRRSRGC